MAVFILGIVAQLINVVQKARAAGAQSKEWTQEESDAFDAKLADVKSGKLPHWVVEPDPTP